MENVIIKREEYCTQLKYTGVHGTREEALQALENAKTINAYGVIEHIQCFSKDVIVKERAKAISDNISNEIIKNLKETKKFIDEINVKYGF